MPGPEKKEKRVPNEDYFSYMERADSWINEGFKESKGYSNVKDFDNLRKKTAMRNIARALALAEAAEREGFKELPEYSLSEDERREEEIKRRGAQIEQSAQFQAVIGSMSTEEIYHFTGKKEEGKKYPDKPVGFTEFAQRYTERSKELTAQIEQKKREQEQRGRLSGLVGDLENSTQKSFTGKLKTLFAGNSAQYKAAFAAMKGLAEGTVKTPEAMNQAKDAIKDYVLARGGKVRDHEYGRDRFDAFMKGLGEVMKPEEFYEVCRGVNAYREETYGSKEKNIDPMQYLPSEEKKQGYRQFDAKVQAAKKAVRRDIRSHVQEQIDEQHKQEQMEQETAQKNADIESRVKADEPRIRADQKAIDHKTLYDHNKTLIEREQKYLDMLRKVTPEKMKDPSFKETADSMTKKVNQHLREHPFFRLVAGPVIEQQGLQKSFHVDEIHTEHMSPEAAELVKQQVKDLQTLDRKKNPNLDIKDVDVKMPKVERKVENKGAELGG